MCKRGADICSLFTHSRHSVLRVLLRAVTMQRWAEEKKKLESVAEIVSVIAIEAVGTVVDGELRAQSYVETVALRQIAVVTERVDAYRKNERFIRRFKG